MVVRKKACVILIFIFSFVCCCIVACGTLGGIGNEIYFPTSKRKVEIAIDSLYNNYPEYKLPGKWKKFNTWSDRGYNFLESRIFYFKSSPEEMYYVTFIGDSTVMADTNKVRIGIRAIDNGIGRWFVEKDLDPKERERIEKRFNDEIVSKLKRYLSIKRQDR
jgi:hypothetical protein